MSNRICVLTPVQARIFEINGQLPNCFNVNRGSDSNGSHQHVSAKEADWLTGADDGTSDARWVGGFRMIAMNVKGGWNTKRSGGVGTKQLTRHPTMLPPANYSIGMLGARERRTSVLATNKPLESPA